MVSTGSTPTMPYLLTEAPARMRITPNIEFLVLTLGFLRILLDMAVSKALL